MIDDGGPAFPRTVQHFNDYMEGKDGMTLRDWFAGQALAGMIVKTPLLMRSTFDNGKTIGPSEEDMEIHTQAVVDAAFKYADAMLAERSEP